MTDIEYLKKYYKGDIEEAIKRLDAGEAVQYIVGNVDFYGYTFDITHDTLMPRFETEELVSKLIDYIKKYFDSNISILDIGTGTGCIAITLANELDAKVTALDISYKALEVASRNNHKYGDKVNIIESDIFSNIDSKFDVIVSNPPYIREDEDIMDIVKTNEPHIALYAKDNGLYFYEKILSEASKYINKKHIIAFEIGSEQGNDIVAIAKKYFKKDIISLEKDMEGMDRFIFIKGE
ncbi:MAG: peptide chain release factor N(5)-glutamine methyltransferase [Bacilli bacterium]|nr:peptide chain release factor N(5)-glutamine methyltransferase [Bacilli bacterium]